MNLLATQMATKNNIHCAVASPGSGLIFGVQAGRLRGTRCSCSSYSTALMPHLPRIQFAGANYHIVTRGDGRRPLFQTLDTTNVVPMDSTRASRRKHRRRQEIRILDRKRPSFEGDARRMPDRNACELNGGTTSRAGLSLWVVGGRQRTKFGATSQKRYAESRQWKQAAREIESTPGLNTEHKA